VASQALCLKSPKSYLETVSTVRGSGWVAVPKCEIAIDYEYDRFTHPLPRTVLTVSKCDLLTLRQSPPDATGLRRGVSRPLLLEPSTAQGRGIRFCWLEESCSGQRETPRCKPVASVSSPLSLIRKNKRALFVLLFPHCSKVFARSRPGLVPTRGDLLHLRHYRCSPPPF
jgi:hypothetical protein